MKNTLRSLLIKIHIFNLQEWDENKLYRNIKMDMVRDTPLSKHTKFEEVLYANRAVKVNGISSAPRVFIDALAGGTVNGEEYDADEMVGAVTKGYIKPAESLHSNLVPYNDYTGSYVIGNHLQAGHYHPHLESRGMMFASKPFNSAADVLLEIIPRIRLHNLVGSCYRK